MKREMIRVRFWHTGGDGTNGYSAEDYLGNRLKWLDESDIEDMIGMKRLAQFMKAERETFSVDLFVFCDKLTKQKDVAQKIIESHRRVFNASRAS